MMDGTKQCAVPGCEAEHAIESHIKECVHCSAAVCVDGCYRQLPVKELFMNWGRKCPDCDRLMNP